MKNTVIILNNTLCMTPKYDKNIKELLTVKRNPRQVYFMRLNNPFVKSEVNYYYKNKYFLRGFVSLLKTKLKDLYIIDKREPLVIVKKQLKANITLRPYQQKAFDTLKDKELGIIYAATNSGKSYIMAKQIEYLGLPTLYVVHRQDIMLQIKEFFEDIFKTRIGIINQKHYDIKFITVATIQTLVNREIPKDIPVLMIDEVHSASGKQYQKLHNMGNFRYRYGYTGTLPKDKEKLYNIISLVGIPYYKITNQELIKYNTSAEPVIAVKHFDKPIHAADWFGVRDRIRYDNERNAWLSNYINTKLKDISTVIFVDSIDYGNLLKDLIKGSVFLHGSLDKKKRKEYIKAFKEGKINKLITTWVLQEGINIPNIKVFVFASTTKSHIRVLQFIGRVVRKTRKDREQVMIVDIVDNNRYTLEHWEQRKKIYKKEKFKVVSL